MRFVPLFCKTEASYSVINFIHLSIHPANGAGLLSNPQLYWRFNIEKRMRQRGASLIITLESSVLCKFYTLFRTFCRKDSEFC